MNNKNLCPIQSLPSCLNGQTGKSLVVLGRYFFMKNQTEIWKEIKGFEGVYAISNHGNLKSFKVDKNGRILKNTHKNGWYLTVNLQTTEKFETRRIHRLVAEYFIPNPENKRQVNHIDGNKQNNHVENLEWVTPCENMAHAILMNPNILKGMNDYNKIIKPRPILQFTINNSFICEHINSNEASKNTGVCQRNILQVANKDEYKPGLTRKQAGGFIWKFKEEKV